MSKKNCISAKTLIEYFGFEALNHERISEFRDICGFSINRAGIELSTKSNSEYLKDFVIAWGKTESLFFKTLSDIEIQNSIRSVLKSKPPLLILSKRFSQDFVDIVLEEADKFEIPLVLAKERSFSGLYLHISAFLIEHLAPTQTIHASLVNINGIGVLIVGQTGIGKSEAVLELIKQNYLFVADDAVVVRRFGEHFYGRSADITKDILEIRGIGLINVKSIFGTRSICDETRIDLVVELVERNAEITEDRLGTWDLTFEILGANLKKIKIRVKEGRNLGTLIESAVNVWLANQERPTPLEYINRRGWGDRGNK